MSSIQREQVERRVRHRAGDAAAVMVFSALTSVAIATTLLLLATLTTRA